MKAFHMKCLFALCAAALLSGPVNAAPKIKTVTLSVGYKHSNAYSLSFKTSPALTFACKDIPQQLGGGLIGTYTLCKTQVIVQAVVHITATKSPRGVLNAPSSPIANEDWSNACAGTKGSECVVKMDADKTAEFRVVNP